MKADCRRDGRVGPLIGPGRNVRRQTTPVGYAVTAEQVRPHAAEHANVLVERASHLGQDVEYTHSHDPTNSNLRGAWI